jgi:creatinine amidohydrolase/Fe(II)-dependent formamide hydrolase-like protein
MAQSIKNCPVLPSYVHANIGETSCVLAARPDLVKMTNAVDEKDYKTFFEYRMDLYTRSEIVGRDITKTAAEFGEQIFSMVIDALVPMIKDALKERIPRNHYKNNNHYNNNKQKKNKH